MKKLYNDTATILNQIFTDDGNDVMMEETARVRHCNTLQGIQQGGSQLFIIIYLWDPWNHNVKAALCFMVCQKVSICFIASDQQLNLKAKLRKPVMNLPSRPFEVRIQQHLRAKKYS